MIQRRSKKYVILVIKDALKMVSDHYISKYHYELISQNANSEEPLQLPLHMYHD